LFGYLFIPLIPFAIFAIKYGEVAAIVIKPVKIKTLKISFTISDLGLLK
jgi:hypothetical protein